MSLTQLIIAYVINLAFWLWIVRWGGAEWLEGTFVSGFLVHIFAPRWSSDGIKLFGWGGDSDQHHFVHRCCLLSGLSGLFLRPTG